MAIITVHSVRFIEDIVDSGKTVILEIDVRGAIEIKKMYPDSILIFILPPSLEELVKRLRNRQTESEADLVKRIERAKMELSLKDKFDYFVENKDLNTAFEETKSLIENIIGVNDGNIPN